MSDGLPWLGRPAPRIVHRRRSIIFPQKDNDGVSLDAENRQIRDELGRMAPGYTEHPTSKGVWYNDNGERFEDDVNEVFMTTPRETDDQIRAKLPEWRDLLRQQALYSDAHDVDLDLV